MAPTLGLTAIGGMTLGFPIGFPLLDLVAWCNIRVPLELVLKGLGNFKIVRAGEPIENSIPFKPGFEHVMALKLVASGATEETPFPPRTIFLLRDDVEVEFISLAKYIRSGLMSTFKDDA